uniref:Uncharacterized protein n=1 Tax=Meloidogyne floridensis TaxID=298350 RepID=A0A915P507_9BILA
MLNRRSLRVYWTLMEEKFVVSYATESNPFDDTLLTTWISGDASIAIRIWWNSTSSTGVKPAFGQKSSAFTTFRK